MESLAQSKIGFTLQSLLFFLYPYEHSLFAIIWHSRDGNEGGKNVGIFFLSL